MSVKQQDEELQEKWSRALQNFWDIITPEELLSLLYNGLDLKIATEMIPVSYWYYMYYKRICKKNENQ